LFFLPFLAFAQKINIFQMPRLLFFFFTRIIDVLFTRL